MMTTLRRIWLLILRLSGEDRRVVVFIVFLMLSSGFWLINALRSEYVSTISYPVLFINLPSDKVVSSEVPASIDLKIRGTGFSLLRYHWAEQLYPYAFDVTKMRRVFDGTLKGAYLVTRDYTHRLSDQLSSDIELVEMTPDTIYISFYDKMTRKVPVRFKGDITFVSQYNQTGEVQFMPDSVSVTGPEYLVDTLNAVNTEYRRFEQIADTIRQSVSLVQMPNVMLSNNNVNVMVPVEAFTEAAVDVPIVVRGVADKMVIKTFPAEVRVSYRVGISRFESVSSQHFLAVVDAAGFDSGNQVRLKVKLEGAPDFVYSVDYFPLFVDYLIERSE
ncbi:YbbR-like domain-containing protein [Breznakibacter xylanolyticus]|nr:YbbR-like domain-containing protein [Breznakibacter xylanolyticus]